MTPDETTEPPDGLRPPEEGGRPGSDYRPPIHSAFR
jgi:hypothetical protein